MTMIDSKPPLAETATDSRPVVVDARVVSESGGGPDKTILNSPRFFDREGYKVLCAYMHPPDDPGYEQIRKRAEAWQAPLHSIPDRGPLDWRVVANALEFCRRENATIWHGHDYKSNALGLLLRPFHRMRLVTTVHGWVRHTNRTKLYYAVDRFCLPRYERVLCVSEDLVERCLEAGVRRDRCVLVENGIDTEAYPAAIDPAEAKRRLEIPADRLVVGAVGRLSPEKGFDTLIRAADRLLRDGLDFELVIAGDGGEAANLAALIETLGRGDRIRLLGYRADPDEIFRGMDLFALSSLREGLPNVLLEAMASGLPVVATRIAGIPRLVINSENGLIVPPESVEALAEGLQRLLTDPAMRERFGRQGRLTIEQRYSFAARIRKIRAIYDELLDPRVPSEAPPT
jgi:glycosyltransferase involved in cell wall biosynthesis